MDEIKSSQNFLETVSRDFITSISKGFISKGDFEKAFLKVMEIFIKRDKQHAEELVRIRELHERTLKLAEEKHDISLKELTGKVDHAFVGERVKALEDSHSERMSYVDQKIASIKNGKDGKSIKGEQGKPGLKGLDGSPDSPIEVREKLESLKGEDRLDKSAIKGLEEALKKSGSSRLLGGVLNVGVRIETPVGTVDGANLTFTAYKVPKWVCVDGVNYFENNGYTYSGKTITLTIAPTGFIRSFY